ncbi:MAG: hypothetical protein AB1791_00180 [Chloroflexota bacterium]
MGALAFLLLGGQWYMSLLAANGRRPTQTGKRPLTARSTVYVWPFNRLFRADEQMIH